MADYVIAENIATVVGIVATAAAGAGTKIAVSVYKGKNAEIEALRASLDAKNAEIKGLLMAQIEAEPARKAALEKIGQTMADQNQLLRSVLASKGV